MGKKLSGSGLFSSAAKKDRVFLVLSFQLLENSDVLRVFLSLLQLLERSRRAGGSLVTEHHGI